MKEYGVDIRRPRPPFILAKYTWQKLLGPMLQPVVQPLLEYLFIAIRLLCALIGIDPGPFGHCETGQLSFPERLFASLRPVQDASVYWQNWDPTDTLKTEAEYVSKRVAAVAAASAARAAAATGGAAVTTSAVAATRGGLLWLWNGAWFADTGAAAALSTVLGTATAAAITASTTSTKPGAVMSDSGIHMDIDEGVYWGMAAEGMDADEYL